VLGALAPDWHESSASSDSIDQLCQRSFLLVEYVGVPFFPDDQHEEGMEPLLLLLVSTGTKLVVPPVNGAATDSICKLACPRIFFLN
jgi:hypothetical protein